MKQVINIRAVVFCLIILGLFASAAQNEYGAGKIIPWSNALIGFTFLIEFFMLFMLKGISGRERAGRMTECLGLFLFFFGIFARSMSWRGAGMEIILGGLITFLYYFADGIIFYVRNRRSGARAAFLTMFTFFICAVGFLALTFKQQHWPLSGILFLVVGVSTGLAFLLAAILRKVTINKQQFNIFRLAEQTRARLGFSFLFVSLWSIYFWMMLWQLVPPLFSLQNPPAYSKMIDELNKVGKTSEEYDRIEIQKDKYYENYERFIWKRHDEQMEKK